MMLFGCGKAMTNRMAPFDPAKRDALEKTVTNLLRGASGRSIPVVPLDLFFEGNRDVGSIGCNLSPHPGVAHFHNVLTRLRSRPEVQDVLVEVDELGDADTWPYSGAVYVLTSLPAADIASSVAALGPEDPIDGPADMPKQTVVGLPQLREGMRVVMLWWD
jgi:hypothetical protein